MSDTADFFRSRLDQMIDLRHPLPVLASRMPWQEIEASVAHLFTRRVRSGKAMVDVDLVTIQPPLSQTPTSPGLPLNSFP